MARITSGSKRLDEILGGGLPVNGINLVIGAPGAGKTILADQYVFANATEGRPALYYCTVSEPYEKLLRYAQGFEFFETAAIGKRVFYDNLGPDLINGGLGDVVKRIADGIKTHCPGLIVIDSFRALSAFADLHDFRLFLTDLAELLTAFPASTFWIGEYAATDIFTAPEFAIADTIVNLSVEHTGLRMKRFVEILKLRGSGFLSGRHTCRISSAGLDVFPRLADPGDASQYTARTDRTATGIAALDALVDEGFLAGSSTLITGPSGSGKTLLGLHYIFSGARGGEPGLVAGFQENPSQLEAVAGAFGWSLREPHVDFMYTSAVDVYIDEWIYALLDRVAATGTRRVLIDSIGDIESTNSDVTRFREFVYSLMQRCRRAGVSLMFTHELPELFDVGHIADNGLSHLADNVVLLQYVHAGEAIRRGITIIKSRGTRHDPRVHEFEISSAGLGLTGRRLVLDGEQPRPD